MVPRLWSLQEHLLQRIHRRPALEASAWRLGETRPILNLMSPEETLLAFCLRFQNRFWAGER